MRETSNFTFYDKFKLNTSFCTIKLTVKLKIDKKL